MSYFFLAELFLLETGLSVSLFQSQVVSDRVAPYVARSSFCNRSSWLCSS